MCVKFQLNIFDLKVFKKYFVYFDVVFLILYLNILFLSSLIVIRSTIFRNCSSIYSKYFQKITISPESDYVHKNRRKVFEMFVLLPKIRASRRPPLALSKMRA